MKRIALVLAVAFITGTALTACGPAANKPAAPAATPTSEATPTASPTGDASPTGEASPTGN